MLSDDGSTRSRGEPHREPRERAMKRRTGGESKRQGKQLMGRDRVVLLMKGGVLLNTQRERDKLSEMKRI